MNEPLGVVLAGGRGRRMSGRKMVAEMAGRPLVDHALDALRVVVADVVVVAKKRSVLPVLDVPLWIEPDEPVHPLAGIAWALEQADGRSVLALAGDMPHVPVELLRRLAGHESPAPALVASHSEGIEPLAGLYRPESQPALWRAAESAAPARDAVAALAETIAWDDREALRSVNAPEDL